MPITAYTAAAPGGQPIYPTGNAQGNAKMMVLLMTGLLGYGPTVAAEVNQAIAAEKNLQKVYGTEVNATDARQNGWQALTSNVTLTAPVLNYSIDTANTSAGIATSLIAILGFAGKAEHAASVERMGAFSALGIVAEKLCNKEFWEVIFGTMADGGDSTLLALMAFSGTLGKSEVTKV